MFDNMKKILIFKLCCFGDAVFITPAIRSLREKFPDSEIVYAHAEWITPLMKYIPSINRTILFEDVYSKNPVKKFLGALKFIWKVRSEKFDMVLYGHRDSRLSLILKLCGMKKRYGFEGTDHLTHTATFNEQIPEFYRYLDILSENGIDPVIHAPRLKRPPVDELRSKLGLEANSRIIGIFCKGGYNPGTKMNVKRWELDNFFELTRMINEKYPEIKVLLLEGTPEHEKFELPPDVIAEKREISNELVACCNTYISIDTGSMHIAAAMGIPTLSIFGPSDPGLVAPENYPGTSGLHRTVRKKVECGPCYTPLTAIDKTNEKHWKDGEFICATGTHKCMKAITPGDVFDELKSMLTPEKISREEKVLG
jgi:heptosyltransferase II